MGSGPGRFFLIFCVISTVLLGLELTDGAQQEFVLPWTALLARGCAWVVTLVDSDVYATANTLISREHAYGLTILPGCNGVEAMIVLCAAVVAYPARWGERLVGFIAGSATVQLINVARLVSLFYLGQVNKDLFEWAHLYAWPALIMLDVFLVWLYWTYRLQRGAPAAQNAG